MAATYRSATANRQRPRGVGLVALFDAVFAGVVPFLTAFAALGGSFPLPGGEALALPLAALSIGIIGAAVGTWQGSNRARIALLALVTLFYAMNIFANAFVATSSFVPAVAQTKAWASVARGIFWLALNYWYWLRPATRAWFRAV